MSFSARIHLVLQQIVLTELTDTMGKKLSSVSYEKEKLKKHITQSIQFLLLLMHTKIILEL